MITAYMYNSNGYYVGSMNVYEDCLPNNSTSIPVDVRDGYIPQWNGKAWEQIENHIGKEGYVNNEPFTIKEYGALPKGWSATPPEPTEEEQLEEQYNNEKRAIDTKYSAPWDGTTSGILIEIQMRMTIAVCETPRNDANVASLDQEYKAELINMKNEFDALDVKYGIA